MQNLICIIFNANLFSQYIFIVNQKYRDYFYKQYSKNRLSPRRKVTPRTLVRDPS